METGGPPRCRGVWGREAGRQRQLESVCGAGKRLGGLGEVIQLQATPTLPLQGKHKVNKNG